MRATSTSIKCNAYIDSFVAGNSAFQTFIVIIADTTNRQLTYHTYMSIFTNNSINTSYKYRCLSYSITSFVYITIDIISIHFYVVAGKLQFFPN